MLSTSAVIQFHQHNMYQKDKTIK